MLTANHLNNTSVIPTCSQCCKVEWTEKIASCRCFCHLRNSVLNAWVDDKDYFVLGILTCGQSSARWVNNDHSFKPFQVFIKDSNFLWHINLFKSSNRPMYDVWSQVYHSMKISFFSTETYKFPVLCFASCL